MGILTNKKDSIISEYFKLLQNVQSHKKGNVIKVALYDDCLKLTSPLVRQEITLKYEQITDVFYDMEESILNIDKNKSSIGRALAGGLLFGGIGAIVGATSGVGVKKVTKKKYKFLFIISYLSCDGEEKFLEFEDTRLYKGKKLSNKLIELAKIDKSNDILNEVTL